MPVCARLTGRARHVAAISVAAVGSLQDDPHRPVVRVGDTVRRPTYPWSPAVHGLLKHLEGVGFPAPRFLGIDDQGREILSYLDGASGPDGWSAVVDEAGLAAFARFLREYHEAVRGYRPADSRWAFAGEGEIICHGDWGPWNAVWRGTEPIGMLDWDYAHPGRPLEDVAYALRYVVPFRDDEQAMRWLRYPRPPDRRRRLRIFAAAYGVPAGGLVDAVIETHHVGLQRVSALAAEGHEPQRSWVAAGHLDQQRAELGWSQEHRHLID